MPYLYERMTREKEDQAKSSANMSQYGLCLVNQIVSPSILINSPFLTEIAFIQESSQDLFCLMLL